VLWPGTNSSPQKNLFGHQGVTDSIWLAELESVFDTWEQRLSESVQMNSEYIAQAESQGLSENPFSSPD
jgi:hypothetical protein